LRAKEALASAVASDLPLLIVGETGTGKELFAAAVHAHGRRSSAPFVAVSCAAISDALFEGELFGHARGSFTGADRARPGLLARANGGVLFLDEIGELPLARQATLLRALETRRFRPVGSDDERAFDVRLVAATNRDLDEAVANGGFRADLLYRLRVLSLALPPLRDRHGDVGPLFAHYAASLGSPGDPRLTLAPAALALLEAYSFPGNVRELRHLVERLAAAGISRVEPAHLPRAVRAVALLVPASSAASGSSDATTGSSTDSSIDASTDDESRAATLRALVAAEHNITHAARALGLTRHGLKKRMKRLGLPSPHKDDEP
jgi:transcriptional regulator with GAF, ATPase, and Fis domain